MKKNPFDIDFPEDSEEPVFDMGPFFTAVILKHYVPCFNISHADKLMSIQELEDLFEQHFPNTGITKARIVQELLTNGFESHQSGESVMWLLRRK